MGFDMLPNDDEDGNKIRAGMAVAAIIIALLFLVATDADTTEEELEQQQYCDMVRAHMKDKSVGWPDFNGNFKEVCEEEKK